MKRKRKIKITPIIIFILLFGYTAWYFGFKEPVTTAKTSSKNAYSQKSLRKLDELDVKSIVNIKKYSKTLDVAIFTDSFQTAYVSDYEKIDYVDIDNFIDLVNIMLDRKYDVNIISKTIKDLTSCKNYNKYNFERYLSYMDKNPSLKLSDVVTRVNIKLDKEFYTDTEEIKNPDNLLVVVNKYNYLPNGFVPKNLKTLFNNSNATMVSEAADAYKELVEAAKKDGFTFVATTAYRSAGFQSTLYNNYMAKDGQEAADTYSARPGYSEHQTGLAADLNDPNYTPRRISPEGYEWLKNNCYKYGFIIRFPGGKEDITGYQEEDWHIRYVGKDVAKKIMDLGLTLEEYVELYVKK